MPDLAPIVEYTFVAQDQLTPTMDRITDANKNLTQATGTAIKSTTEQNVSFLAQVAAVTMVYRGMSRLTSSFTELGLISDSNAASLQKMLSVVGLVVGGFQLMKGAVKVMEMLRTSTAGLAIIETYRSVLNKGPVAVALAGAALGVAAGIGGYMLGSSSTTVNQTVNFQGSSSVNSKAAARESLEMMGGGG